MYLENNKVFVENDDMCINCKNFTNGVKCPLLQALSLGYAKLEESMQVTNCEFFENNKTHLKVINSNNKNNS